MAGLTGFQTPPWATMPMPQGWEAKYEPSVGRYFFINHVQKKTQWVDPRQAIYQAQQRSPQPPRAPQPPPQAQQIPMQPISKPKCKTCKHNEVDSAGQQCGACKLEQQQREIELMRAREEMEEEKRRREQEAKLEKERERRRVQSARRRQQEQATALEVLETEFGEEVEVDKDAVKAEMKKIFPQTDRDVLDMILETCSYDKEKTIEALTSMGEKRVAIKSPKRSPKPPKKTTPAAGPSTSAAAAAPTLSKQQKDQMKARLMKGYPKAGDLMVGMALETTHYNEAKARQVLDLYKDEEGSKSQSTTESTAVTFPETTPTSTVTSTTTSTSATTTQESDPSSKTGEVSFPGTRPTTTSTLTSGGASRGGSATSAASLSAVKVSVTPSSPKRAQQPKVIGSQHKVTVGSPAKRAAKAPSSGTKMAAKKSAGSAKHAFDFKMKPAVPLSSERKTLAKGADPSLATGPNLDNLKDDYEPAFGPNKEFAKGPDKDNVVGPAGSLGMDHSLASGPDPANRAGPEPGLAKGSMIQSLRQC